MNLVIVGGGQASFTERQVPISGESTSGVETFRTVTAIEDDSHRFLGYTGRQHIEIWDTQTGEKTDDYYRDVGFGGLVWESPSSADSPNDVDITYSGNLHLHVVHTTVSVTATFEEITSFTLKTSAEGSGSAKPYSETRMGVPIGGSVSFAVEATPDAGFVFRGWYDGERLVLRRRSGYVSFVVSKLIETKNLVAKFREATGLPIYGKSGEILYSSDGSILCDA